MGTSATYGFANAAKCGENKALIRQSLIPGLGELNPGISGLEKCPGFRDPGINSLVIDKLVIISCCCSSRASIVKERYCRNALDQSRHLGRSLTLDPCMVVGSLKFQRCISLNAHMSWRNTTLDFRLVR